MDRQRLIDSFCEFVKIPSESPNDLAFVAHMEDLLKKEGARTVKDDFGNLIAKFPAINSNSSESVAFSCHADTVKPGVGIKPIIDGEIIKSDGTTILGADDKAGIAILVEMIKSAKKRPPVEIIITRCEEIGTEGSSNMNYKLVDSKFAYVLDEESINDIVIGAPTKFAFYVEYRGVAAHATEPENGASAILAVSKAVSRLRLGRLDHETTANVGMIEGGQVVNSIPEKAKIVAECRSCDHQKAVALAEEMKQIFNDVARESGVQVLIESGIKYYAFKLNEDAPVLRLALDALSKNGVKAEMKVITGGLDANNFNKNGISTATLGVGFREIHTKNEYVIIKDMEIMTKTLISLVEGLA